jgi:hypothetical protein
MAAGLGTAVTLPSDEEYLNQLYEQFAVEESWMRTVSEDELAALTPELQRQLRREFADPRLAFTGIQIDEIRRAALAFLGKDKDRVAAIPVGLLPTRELNGAAVWTPRGGAVILLNNSVFWALPLIFFSYAALDSWDTDDALTKALPDVAFAEALLDLAAFCATDDIRHLTDVGHVMRALIDGDSEEQVIKNAVFMECFVLLHEYGHVLCGHLKPDETTTLAMRSADDALVTSRTHWDHEFEADAFAVKYMLRSGSGQLRATDVAVWPGLVLQFFGLVELVGSSLGVAQAPATHPPARERWERVAKLVELDSAPDAYAARFDYWFARIAHWWTDERLGTSSA